MRPGKINFLVFLFFLLSNITNAQDSLAIGEWESYLPYSTANYVSQSPEKIIFSTRWSLFTIDKMDFSIEFIDKINTLSDIGIQKHAYDTLQEQLLIAYDNSNIDIIKGNEVFNIPDIKNNTNINGDKKIYNINFNADYSAYLSCGFGIVGFDMSSYEFDFTCFTGMPVYQTIQYGKLILTATEDGLYSFDTEEQNNPADFQTWTFLGSANGLPQVYKSIDLIVWDEHIYMVTEDELWKAGGDLLFSKIYETDNDSNISFLNKTTAELMLGVSWVYDQSRILFFDSEDQFMQTHQDCSNRINYAVMDQQNRIWFADKIGDIRYTENKILPCESIKINAPYSNNVSDVEVLGDKVFIASGGVDASYRSIYRRDGFFVWDGEKWENYNEQSYPLFVEEELMDFFRVLPHPDRKILYIGSYIGGLVALDLTDNSMQVFNQENSTLAGKPGDELRERVSGLALDGDDNLWVSNFGAPKPISVFTRDENWHALSVISNKDLRDVTIDRNGYKWFIIDRDAQGVLVYDEGERVEDPTDDRQRIISKNNSALESNNINAIEVDLDGDVWVGTSAGPVVFECGSNVFDDCQGSRRKTVLEGIPAYLLDEVNITCIETDGANRKWFGSENGVFVQSPSGEEQIYHFTQENSPLFDNIIIDLAYNGENGTMFIATAKGVLSFRTQTSTGGRKHRSDVYAYPNPVRPEYTGPIAIKGFARDANVKITDINGQLIYETTALGGQAIWNGRDYNGRKAASGVYLVYASSVDSFEEPDAMVTKILFINGD